MKPTVAGARKIIATLRSPRFRRRPGGLGSPRRSCLVGGALVVTVTGISFSVCDSAGLADRGHIQQDRVLRPLHGDQYPERGQRGAVQLHTSTVGLPGGAARVGSG